MDPAAPPQAAAPPPHAAAPPPHAAPSLQAALPPPPPQAPRPVGTRPPPPAAPPQAAAPPPHAAAPSLHAALPPPPPPAPRPVGTRPPPPDMRDERLRQLDSLRRAKAAAQPRPAALSPAMAAGALAALTSQARQHTARREEEPQRRNEERIDVADSPNPVDVKKALTFKGATVAWAILKRHKIIESRPVRLPTGGWIAAHVGKGAFKGDYSMRIPNCPSEEFLSQRYMGCIVGLFKIKDCRRPNNCGGSVWAEGPVCNVVEAVIELPSPVPVTKGKLHVWVMDEGTRLRVVAQLASLPIQYTDLSSLPPFEPIIGPITPGRNRSYNRTDEPASMRPPSWVDEAAPLPVKNDYGVRYGGYNTEGYYQGVTGGYAQQYAAAHPLAPAAAHYYAPPPGYNPYPPPPHHGYASPAYPPRPAPRRHSPPPREICEGALAWYDSLQRRPPGG